MTDLFLEKALLLNNYSDTAILQIRDAINETKGNEVFFLGTTDMEKQVLSVDVLARGSSDAVPAILQACSHGDVVIHNHPSGHLEPSAADIEIASRLGALGVGFHIVDNSVENVYKVVEIFSPREQHHLTPDAIVTILGPGGSVAGSLPGYEERPEQLQMALGVAETFNHDRVAVIEAGTGTGKSLAYLVPAILWSRNNEERVIISTKTINLQEFGQAFYGDQQANKPSGTANPQGYSILTENLRSRFPGGSGQGAWQLSLPTTTEECGRRAGAVRHGPVFRAASP